jgi:hypothetical protein
VVYFDVPVACRCATGIGNAFILEMQKCAESRHYNQSVYYCAWEFVHYGDIEWKLIMVKSEDCEEEERKKLC